MVQDKLSALPEAVRAAIAEASAETLLEAVPAHMMELFSDRQWPELVFQFQPSLRLIETGRVDDSDQKLRWIVFRTSSDVLVRPATGVDYAGLTLFLAGNNFDQVATVLWPERNREARYRKLTDEMIRWLQEGLITDAGVALPEDATFELDPDDATQSYASSPAPGKGNR